MTGRPPDRTPASRGDFPRYRASRTQNNTLQPWQRKEGCIPSVSPAYAWPMEDVLAWYAAPDDPRYPHVCVDESPVPWTSERRRPRPARPGQPACYNCAYNREGTATRLLLVQPRRGWRHVNVTTQRTQQDCAQPMRLLVEVYFPTADRVRLVVDNLNTPPPAALYRVFAPAEAGRITQQLAFHYTPKHGSGLHRAECEFAVLARQGLDRRVPDSETLRQAIAAWQIQRNQHRAKINWQFGTDLARAKLKRLYPPLEQPEDTLRQEASSPVNISASDH